ncbi:MAG: hypothetical protein Q8R12_03375 [bacterium]|nr:hypothetical protein [bacterium]
MGVILWGATGFLELLEYWGDGVLSDLVPMLTLEGFIARRRERGEEPVEFKPEAVIETLPSASGRGGIGIEVICGAGGAFLGLLLWVLGIATFWWMIGLALLGAALGFFLRVSDQIEIPRAWLVGAAAVVGVLLVLNLGNLFRLGLFTRAEDYRAEAWQFLKSEGDVRLVVAERIDKLGAAAGLGTGETNIVASGREIAASLLEKQKGFGVPALDDLKGWALGKLKPPVPQPPSKETEPAPSETTRLEGEIKTLGLGALEARLYRSDFVLERAAKLRNGKVSFWWKVALGLGMILGLTVALLFRQSGGIVAPINPGPGPAPDPYMARMI